MAGQVLVDLQLLHQAAGAGLDCRVQAETLLVRQRVPLALMVASLVRLLATLEQHKPRSVGLVAEAVPKLVVPVAAGHLSLAQVVVAQGAARVPPHRMAVVVLAVSPGLPSLIQRHQTSPVVMLHLASAALAVLVVLHQPQLLFPVTLAASPVVAVAVVEHPSQAAQQPQAD